MTLTINEIPCKNYNICIFSQYFTMKNTFTFELNTNTGKFDITLKNYTYAYKIVENVN